MFFDKRYNRAITDILHTTSGATACRLLGEQYQSATPGLAFRVVDLVDLMARAYSAIVGDPRKSGLTPQAAAMAAVRLLRDELLRSEDPRATVSGSHYTLH
jgi:hypothetical protein